MVSTETCRIRGGGKGKVGDDESGSHVVLHQCLDTFSTPSTMTGDTNGSRLGGEYC